MMMDSSSEQEFNKKYIKDDPDLFNVLFDAVPINGSPVTKVQAMNICRTMLNTMISDSRIEIRKV